jgi:type IV pilus assembly protein PilQ
LPTVLVAGALLSASGPTTDPSATTAARLKTISSRVHAKGASLVIEATDPVAYVATRPDPLTVMLDFRNVDARGVSNSVVENAKSPISNVAVESDDVTGTSAPRVRITLSQPVVHHVRSEKNTIVVDFDKPSGKPYVLPPTSSAVSSPKAQGAPDAMKALDVAERPALDPIAALGLNVSAVSAPSQGNPAARVGTVLQNPPGPPAPPTLPSGVAPAGGGQQQRYTGNPISLDFQGGDLRAVLRVFAEVSGLNIVIDPTVMGTVDVSLRDVPWDQALDIILRANKLGYVVDGTIVRIAPIAVLAAEEKERSDLAKAQADAGQLGTLTRQLSYSKGEEMVALLKQANVLSARGQAFVDTRTNTLIVTDLQERLGSTADLLNTLDKPQPQVEIEARIVQTTKNYARALGIQWGFNGRVDPALGNTTPLAFPNSGSVGGRTGGTQGPAGGTQVPTAINYAASAAASAIGLALGSVNGAFALDVALTALETSGNGRLLSTPRVTTQNNVAAEMVQGVQIPIQTVANNTVTVTFKDAALTLKVTPQITAANTVIMQIAIENASPDFSRAINNIPPINTQRANTTVLVNDQQTTVIGGIYVSQEQAASDKTPGLSRLPLLGWLFQRNTLNDQSTELLIFITPRIIKG